MANYRVIASDLGFPEGPVVLADGSIIVDEVARGTLVRVFPDGTKVVLAETGGGPNGTALGPDGMLYVCNNGGHRWVEQDGLLMPQPGSDHSQSAPRIDRVDPATGTVEVLYTHAGDHALVGPNDIVFDSDGGFWFTDVGAIRSRTKDHGGIYYAKIDGSFIEEVIYPLDGPNGIGLSPDGRTLYAAETFPCNLLAWDIVAPGKVAKQQGFVMDGGGRFVYSPPGNAFFDSLAVEASGNICVATLVNGGISVISPDGDLVEFVPVDDFATSNIAFGGDDMRTAYITCSSTGRLIAMDWARPGLRLAF